MDRFAASPDDNVRATTRAFWLLLFVSSLAGAAGGMAALGPWFLLPILLVTLPLAAVPLFAPRGYAIGPDSLEVERLAGPIRLPVPTIAAARAVTREALGPLTRRFGVGGAHGHFGAFHAGALGPLQVQVTRWDRLVLVERRGAPPLLLSPDQPEAFLARLQRAVGGS